NATAGIARAPTALRLVGRLPPAYLRVLMEWLALVYCSQSSMAGGEGRGQCLPPFAFAGNAAVNIAHTRAGRAIVSLTRKGAQVIQDRLRNLEISIEPPAQGDLRLGIAMEVGAPGNRE